MSLPSFLFQYKFPLHFNSRSHTGAIFNRLGNSDGSNFNSRSHTGAIRELIQISTRFLVVISHTSSLIYTHYSTVITYCTEFLTNLFGNRIFSCKQMYSKHIGFQILSTYSNNSCLLFFTIFYIRNTMIYNIYNYPLQKFIIYKSYKIHIDFQLYYFYNFKYNFQQNF